MGPGVPTHDAQATALAGVIASMATTLAAGEAGFDGTKLYLKGAYVDDAAKARLDAAAAAASIGGGDVALSPRPVATVDQATQLEQELNAVVNVTPIPFDTAKATLRPEAAAILDKVAALARKYAGVTIGVDGYTDADGAAAADLTLSQHRADAVKGALMALGVPDAQLKADRVRCHQLRRPVRTRAGPSDVDLGSGRDPGWGS